MTTSNLQFHPSAHLVFKNDDVEQKIDKKLNDVNNFINSIINIEFLIVNFRDKNYKSKQKDRIYKRQTSILQSLDTDVIIRAPTTSVTLSGNGVGLIVVPTSAGIAYALSLGPKVIHNIFINK